MPKLELRQQRIYSGVNMDKSKITGITIIKKSPGTKPIPYKCGIIHVYINANEEDINLAKNRIDDWNRSEEIALKKKKEWTEDDEAFLDRMSS
jgi:hypothetical protein